MKKQAIPSNLLSVAEVAMWLNISRPMVYKLIKSRDLPAVKIGRRILLKREDIQDFIDARKVHSVLGFQ